MSLMTCRHPRGWWLPGLSRLLLLLSLTACAATPSLSGPEWVDVDFEVPPPGRAGELLQGGVQLPRVSQAMADPRAHRDFIDLRVTAVGFGITAGGYLLYCEGLPLPVLVPETQVDLGLTRTQPLNESIYPDRDTALGDMEARAPESKHTRYAYYRGAGGVLIVPTLFSPATTPRIARTMLEVRKHLAESVQRELKVMLLTLTGTRVLQGIFSRVVRVGSEPERLGGEAPAPRQLGPRQSDPRTIEPAPGPVPAPTASVPSPAAPAPSPGLVQALTGNNSTRPVAPGPRLPQDVAVSPKVPRPRETNRPIGHSPTQNDQLQADIHYLENIGATNIRVNQQQLKLDNGQRVGTNRPDLQFDYNGRRYHVEYDTPTSGRGVGHQSRITSNDPDAEILLLIVP